MNLNKYKSKNGKFAFDGVRIIKVGKKELYSIVYKRTYDLTSYSATTLEKYGLERAIYFYVGSTNAYNLKARCSKWRYVIINKKTGICKDIKIFLNKLKIFYSLETNLNKNDICETLYYNGEIMARCSSLKGARELERVYTEQFQFKEFFKDIADTKIILLSNRISSYKVCSKLFKNKPKFIQVLQKKIKT